MSAQKKSNLKNIMEDIVWAIIADVVEKDTELCKCEMCLNDIAALILNEIPPKYVVREMGEAYCRISVLENQYKADIYAALSKAITKVKNSPRHNDSTLKSF